MRSLGGSGDVREKGCVMDCERSFRWGVGMIVFLAALCGMALGCTMHVDLKTHAQDWETRRDRVALNQGIDEFQVKSLNQYRGEHRAAKLASEQK